MANIKIAIINSGKALKDSQVQAALPALQTQVSRDFAPAWGIDADLNFIPKGTKPAPGSWWLTILDNSDQAGALGYHDVTNDGLPLGKVLAGSDIKFGFQWTVTASQELLEMLAGTLVFKNRIRERKRMRDGLGIEPGAHALRDDAHEIVLKVFRDAGDE